MPIRVRVGRAVALLAVVAAVMLVIAWAMGWSGARWGALAAAVLCAALVPVVRFGPPSRRAILFEPEGLRLVEPAWELRVPWDEIVGVTLVDVHDTLVAAFTLRDPGRLAPIPRAPGEQPAAALRRVARAVRINRALYGCDLTVVPATYGLDPVLYVRAVQTYVTDAGARAGLAPRAALHAAP